MEPTAQNKILSLSVTVLLHLGLAIIAVYWSSTDNVRTARSELKVSNVIAITPPTPPPPPPPKPQVKKEVKPQGAASPQNIKSKAAPKEAPKPIVKIKPKKPQAVAVKAGAGNDSAAGNADKPGPGSGAGGLGNGTGAGGNGNGGGGVKLLSRAAYISGRIKNSDYPRGASKANASGSVIVRYTILPNGRAANCRVTGSSGNSDLDSITCRLIEKRFRYKPARDTNGNAIEDVTGWKQDWWFEGKRKAEEATE
jgi:periplasmic protein TonB